MEWVIIIAASACIGAGSNAWLALGAFMIAGVLQLGIDDCKNPLNKY